MDNSKSFAKKSIIFSSTAALVIVLILLVKETMQVLLLVFAGILLAVFFRGLALLVKKVINVKQRWALTISIALLILLTSIIIIFIVPGVSESITNLEKEIPAAAERLEKRIIEYSWGETLLKNIKEFTSGITENPDTWKRATGIFSSFLSVLTAVLVIFIIGMYTAFSPGEYTRGFLKIFPKQKRERIDEILSKVEHGLLWWMVGRFSSMAIVGILTAIGLLIIDVPLAIPLGIFAALLSFIPNIGPIISAIPAVALGFIDSSQKALYVAVLYIGIQLVESYMITPVIQKKSVSISPALLLSVQLIIGVLLGIFGLILATPLMVVIIILIQTLYIQDILDDDVEVLGEK